MIYYSREGKDTKDQDVTRQESSVSAQKRRLRYTFIDLNVVSIMTGIAGSSIKLFPTLILQKYIPRLAPRCCSICLVNITFNPICITVYIENAQYSSCVLY